jgi:hypothetical protein
MRDMKFAVTMALVILGMVIGMALLAAGCTTSDVEIRKVRIDGACFVIAEGYQSVAIAKYDCPVAKEQLL